MPFTRLLACSMVIAPLIARSARHGAISDKKYQVASINAGDIVGSEQVNVSASHTVSHVVNRAAVHVNSSFLDSSMRR
jgi:hypothetical protein